MSMLAPLAECRSSNTRLFRANSITLFVRGSIPSFFARSRICETSSIDAKNMASRFTVDLDAMFLASIEDVSHILDLAKKEGIEPRTNKVMEFARKSRVLLLRHSASGASIDISLGVLPFEEEVVERSKLHEIGMLSVRLPTPEDLIIMKAIAHRPKDLIDIQTIIDSHPELDVDRIRHWVKSFADILE